MPPLLEAEFRLLLGLFGFVLAVVMFRASSCGQLVDDYRVVKDAGIIGRFDPVMRKFRLATWTSVLLVACATALTVGVVMQMWHAFREYGAVARAVDQTDAVVQNLLTDGAKAASRSAMGWVSALGLVGIADFLVSLIRRRYREEPERAPRWGHPAELSGVGSYAPLSLWEQRIRASFGDEVPRSAEQERLLVNWRREWESWAEAVDRYGDAIASDAEDEDGEDDVAKPAA